MGKNLTKENKLVRVKAASGAATTDIHSDIVDTQGYGTVAFLTSSQAVVSTATAAVVIQHGDDASLTDAASVAGSTLSYTKAGTTDDSNTPLFIEAAGPTKRYVRLFIDRGTANSAFGEIFCLLGQAKRTPVAQDAKTNLVATAGDAA